MQLTKVDIWLQKIEHGWKIEDVPIYIRPEIEKILAEKTLIKANKK